MLYVDIAVALIVTVSAWLTDVNKFMLLLPLRPRRLPAPNLQDNSKEQRHWACLHMHLSASKFNVH